MAVTKRHFDKEMFKRSVVYNVKTLYRRNIEEATQQQIFHAADSQSRAHGSDQQPAAKGADQQQSPKNAAAQGEN